MTSRRKFLQALGVGSVIGPFATKAAADAAAAQLSGVSTLGTGMAGGIPFNSNPTAAGSSEPWWRAARRFFESHDLPEFVERRMRKQARYVNYLDPDIACKRSWSFAVKVQHQRQRNYERLKSDRLEAHFDDSEQHSFAERWGFWI